MYRINGLLLAIIVSCAISCKKIAMDKLEGTWRMHKIIWSDGNEIYSESNGTCGTSAPFFGLYCKWRWELDNKGNATYSLCQDFNDSSCATGYGTYELLDNNKKIVFHGSFFSAAVTPFGCDSVLVLEELKRDRFKVGMIQTDTLDNTYKHIFEFKKL